MSLLHLTLLVLIVFSIPLAYGDIGIDISTKCKTMIKNSFDTPCPTIAEILALFPDTSPQKEVGKFEVIDGMVQRGQSPYSIDNYYQYMKGLPEKERIWVNPPAGARPFLTMINIESNFEDYPIKESYKMSNNTISMGTKRHANLGCTDIIVNAEDWVFLTGDTIVWAQHDCDPKFTNFNHIKKYYFEKSFQDITTSYKYILEKWIAESMIKCKGLCFEY